MTQPSQDPALNMYGYNPMYLPQQFQFPKGYWIMPDEYGLPIEEIPPAQGNLLQAWFSIGVRISRRNIAGWANKAKPFWTPVSLLVAFVAPIIGSFIFGLMIFQLAYNQFVQSTQYSATSGAPPFTSELAHSMFTVELFFIFIMLIMQNIAGFFIFVSYVSGAANKYLGTFKARYRRAIQPIALAYAPIGIVQCFMFVIYGIGVIIMSNQSVLSMLSILGNYSYTSIAALIAGFFLVFIPINVLLPIYTYTLLAQSGNVGAGVNRWGVFGLYIAASFTAGICALPIAGIISFIVMMFVMK